MKIGDTVRLRSGGPLMTIIEYKPEKGLFTCGYFVADTTWNAGYFPEEALEESQRETGKR